MKIIKEECIPPSFKVSIECALLIAECAGALALSNNPVTGAFSTSLAIGSATRVLMRRL